MTTHSIFSVKHAIFIFSNVVCGVYLIWGGMQSVVAQEAELPVLLEQYIELLAENNQQESDWTELTDQLLLLLKDPVNLNDAEADELAGLWLLNANQINGILQYRKRHGQMYSLNELQVIDGFYYDLIDRIKPFVTLGKRKTEQVSLRKVLHGGHHELLFRGRQVLQKEAGYYKDNGYLGSPYHILTRYRFNYKQKVSAGYTAEKDAGEPAFAWNQPAMDFQSAHLLLHDIGKIKTLAIGDYQLQFGQGLTLWTGYAMGQSAEVINLKKYGAGIKSYTSSGESNFLRGGATTVAFGPTELTVFYANKQIDGNVIRLDSTRHHVLAVSALQETGYHRTVAERNDQDALREAVAGANIQYIDQQFRAGVTAFSLNYDALVEPRIQPYNRFYFSGHSHQAVGVDYSYQFRKACVFGETTYAGNGGMALLLGGLAALSHELALSVLYRHYDAHFHPAFSSAFSAGSYNRNESGIFLGADFRPSHKWSFQASCDRYSFGWLRYQVDAPSRGTDYYMQVNYAMADNLQVYLRYRLKTSEVNGSSEQPVSYVVPKTGQQLRLHMQYALSSTVTLKSRMEFKSNRCEGNLHSGFLMFQDVVWQQQDKPVSVKVRYALFGTDTYDERLYAYEDDLLYAFSIPAYYDQGSRVYGMISCRVWQNLTLWLRYGQSFFPGKQTIGTGHAAIAGHLKSELKLQLRFTF